LIYNLLLSQSMSDLNKLFGKPSQPQPPSNDRQFSSKQPPRPESKNLFGAQSQSSQPISKPSQPLTTILSTPLRRT